MAESTPRAALEVDGVSVWYSGRQVLSEVTFHINAGEFVGLIGSNGAGKSTLLRVILGLQPAGSGSVRTPGQSGADAGTALGYVPQKVVFDPDVPLRARDLVELGLDGNRLGIPLPSRRRRQLVDEMLAAVDGTGFADTRIGNLSGGEAQRTLIAHALVRRPRLLILDEPLSNLDLRSEQGVVTLLSRIAKEQGIAVLIAAHEMNPLLPVMDRVVYLANGRAASGTTDEVIRAEVLSSLYGSHVDVVRLHDRVLVVAGSQVEADIASTDHGNAAVVDHVRPS